MVLIHLPECIFPAYSYEADFLPQARMLVPWLKDNPANVNPFWRHKFGGKGHFVEVINNVDQMVYMITAEIGT